MKKRLLILLLTLLLCFTGLSVTAFAENEPPQAELTLKSDRLPDGKVSLTVSICNNPGITGYQLSINYDSTLLTPVSTTKRIVAGTFLSGLNPDPPAVYSGPPLYCTWANASAVTEDTELYSIEFSLGEFVLFTDISISGSLSDNDLNRIEPEPVTYRLYANRLSCSFVHEAADITLSNGQLSGAVTASVLSSGTAFSGNALAILAIYDESGKILATRSCTAIINQNDITEVSFSDLSLSVSGSRAILKLLLLDPAAGHRPLTAAAQTEIQQQK